MGFLDNLELGVAALVDVAAEQARAHPFLALVTNTTALGALQPLAPGVYAEQVARDPSAETIGTSKENVITNAAREGASMEQLRHLATAAGEHAEAKYGGPTGLAEEAGQRLVKQLTPELPDFEWLKWAGLALAVTAGGVVVTVVSLAVLEASKTARVAAHALGVSEKRDAAP